MTAAAGVGRPVPRYPVIGELRPYLVRGGIASHFDEFETETMQGLARVVGPRLEILAIAAHRPGHGDCGRFLAACMAAYDVVCVWEVLNAELDAMLERRGFTRVVKWIDREMAEGREWTQGSLALGPGREG